MAKDYRVNFEEIKAQADFVALDGDEPGREAAQKVAAVLAQSWWTRIAHLADGIQPDTVEDAELKRLLERDRQQ